MTKKQQRESQVIKYWENYYSDIGETVISSQITNRAKIDKDGYYRYILNVYTNLGSHIFNFYAKFNDENTLI